MDKETADLIWDEKFIAKFNDEVLLRKTRMHKAREHHACPSCGAKPGEHCGYVILDAHMTEEMPDGWVHARRWQLQKDVEDKLAVEEQKKAHAKAVEDQKALSDML